MSRSSCPQTSPFVNLSLALFVEQNVGVIGYFRVNVGQGGLLRRSWELGIGIIHYYRKVNTLNLFLIQDNASQLTVTDMRVLVCIRSLHHNGHYYDNWYNF